MKAIVQRVREASVDSIVNGVTTRVGTISQGLLVFVGITHTDVEQTAIKMANKIWHLRIMNDTAQVMNLSVAQTTRSILVVSQFTLYADTNTGRRPSWIAAAKPEIAEPLVTKLVEELRRLGALVETGHFRTQMMVSSVNDGPCTVALEI